MKPLLHFVMTDLADLNNAVTKIKDAIQSDSIILLSGGLSAGKTTFVSNFAQSFGIQIVQSPTYSIHQRYHGGNIIIDHFDLYRLSSEEELDSSGFYDLLTSKSDYKFIEWSQRLANEDLPLGIKIYLIEIEQSEKNIRTLNLFEKV